MNTTKIMSIRFFFPWKKYQERLITIFNQRDVMISIVRFFESDIFDSKERYNLLYNDCVLSQSMSPSY